jgi:hypothetical protein
MGSLDENRAAFRTTAAPSLVTQLGLGEIAPWPGKGSTRFAYFADDSHFVVVAGEQEETATDLALAYGLSYRTASQQLVLVLPEGRAHPTLQRGPWFHEDARPIVYLHDGETARATALPTRPATIEAFTDRLPPGATLQTELRASSAPAHLGDRSDPIEQLVEWATRESVLDPGHRPGERSWHCMGQRVLSIKSTTDGLAVRAGIHTQAGNPPLPIVKGEGLTASQLAMIQDRVRAGVDARLSGEYRKPDEHWLQAVIRRDPSLVGVEQPALREVPAWRPNASDKTWGRGFIDLLGVDGHGDLRVVETKLAKNSDDLLILQGLDYFLWSTAYGDVVRERIGAPNRSRIVVHYVVGASPGGAVHLSVHARRHVEVLDIPYRFQIVTDWFTDPLGADARATLLDRGAVPG